MDAQPIRYITPAVTPLLPDGSLDLPSCQRLYRHLVQGGMDGILILGSIGEFFSLTLEQKKELIRCARKEVGRDTLLLAGTASMVFDEIPALSNFALDEGVNAVMIIPPYYFRFPDEAVFRYYDTLAGLIHGGIYIYNFPERTGYSVSPQVIRDLAAKHKNIIGLKDTVGGVDHTREVIKQVRPVRPDFQVYSGFDDNFGHNILCGGNGCISGLSNIFPELASAWTRAMRAGDLKKAKHYQRVTDSLMDIYNVSDPFIPAIKEGLVQKGVLVHATATKPMTELAEAQKKELAQLMERYPGEA